MAVFLVGYRQLTRTPLLTTIIVQDHPIDVVVARLETKQQHTQREQTMVTLQNPKITTHGEQIVSSHIKKTCSFFTLFFCEIEIANG